MTGQDLADEIRRLQALRPPRHDETAIIDRIAAHLDQNAGYLAFSGGKDSTLVLDLARRADPGVPVVFFDSGLEYPETVEFVERTADRWRLNLDWVQVRPTALDVLMSNGTWAYHQPESPGLDMFETLIGAPARQAHERHGPGELWGLRADESHGRAVRLAAALAGPPCPCCAGPAERRARHGGAYARRDGTLPYSPVWDWTADDVWAHLRRRGVPANPVYAKLESLGAAGRDLRLCLMVDANHLAHGRAHLLKTGWPALFNQLAQALPRLREYA